MNLKEIKERYNPKEWYEGHHLNPEEIEWLIKQAERVQDLEEQNSELKSDKGVLEIAIAYVHLPKIERYKQALEFYADESNHTEHRGTRIFGDVFYDKGEKARQALEADAQ